METFPVTTEHVQDMDSYRMSENSNKQATLQLNIEFSMLKESFITSNAHRGEPFKLHRELPMDTPLPEHQILSPGISPVPAFFQSTRVIHANPETSRELRPDYEAD